MNKVQLDHFRNILNGWKRDLMEEVDRTVSHMKDEAANFPDPNDRATQEEEFSLELRTRDRERKLIRKIDEALKRVEDGSLRLLPGDRRRNRREAAGSPARRHAHHRGAGTPRTPRKTVRRPGRPLPLDRRGSMTPTARTPAFRAAFSVVGREPLRIPWPVSRPRPPAPFTWARSWLRSAAISSARRRRRLARAHGRPRHAARDPGAPTTCCARSKRSASNGTAKSSFQSTRRAAYPRRSCADRLRPHLFAAAVRARISPARGEDSPGYPGTCRAGASRPRAGLATLSRERRNYLLRRPFPGHTAISTSPTAATSCRRRDGILATSSRWWSTTPFNRSPGLCGVRTCFEHSVADRSSAALSLPQPIYGHLPLVVEPDGAKLSKSRRALPLDPDESGPSCLSATLTHLSQAPPPICAHLRY